MYHAEGARVRVFLGLLGLLGYHSECARVREGDEVPNVSSQIDKREEKHNRDDLTEHTTIDHMDTKCRTAFCGLSYHKANNGFVYYIGR